ncbi:MAG: hypothetical protein FWF02_09515 [Micrococcales bacterium]|nr:hypothetical protein [Micrococcales bacterium]MCL2667927.1 hypothetical protein [Micrococcales bacterium]
MSSDADRTRGISARLSRLAPQDRTHLVTLVRRITEDDVRAQVPVTSPDA